MAGNMNSDADYVESVMMTQSLLKPVDPSKAGGNEGSSRKRAFSGDDESEASKKLKPTEGISDLVDLMKAQFTPFRADFQDMCSEKTSTLYFV